jgi:hypothetical protein
VVAVSVVLLPIVGAIVFRPQPTQPGTRLLGVGACVVACVFTTHLRYAAPTTETQATAVVASGRHSCPPPTTRSCFWPVYFRQCDNNKYWFRWTTGATRTGAPKESTGDFTGCAVFLLVNGVGRVSCSLLLYGGCGTSWSLSNRCRPSSSSSTAAVMVVSHQRRVEPTRSMDGGVRGTGQRPARSVACRDCISCSCWWRWWKRLRV